MCQRTEGGKKKKGGGVVILSIQSTPKHRLLSDVGKGKEEKKDAAKPGFKEKQRKGKFLKRRRRAHG